MWNSDIIAITVHSVHIFSRGAGAAVEIDVFAVKLNPILCIKDVELVITGELDDVVRLLGDGGQAIE